MEDLEVRVQEMSENEIVTDTGMVDVLETEVTETEPVDVLQTEITETEVVDVLEAETLEIQETESDEILDSDVQDIDILEQNETVEQHEVSDVRKLTTGSEQHRETSNEKIIRFPLTRIKNIMKTDPDVSMASQDAAILIAKATELFIENLTREAFTYTTQTKRKTIQRKDLEVAIDRIETLAFLEGALDW